MPTSRTYVILTAAQALGIDFSQVLENSPSTLRWSSDNSHTFVKFETGETPDFLRGPQIVPDRGPVLAAPLIDRWQAMLETLRDSERRAKCLARTLQRQQARGEPKPFITPVPKTHAMPAALGIVSGGLTVQLIEALKGWPDTS